MEYGCTEFLNFYSFIKLHLGRLKLIIKYPNYIFFKPVHRQQEQKALTSMPSQETQSKIP